MDQFRACVFHVGSLQPLGVSDTDTSLFARVFTSCILEMEERQELGRARHFLFLDPVDDYPASFSSAEWSHHCRCPPGCQAH